MKKILVLGRGEWTTQAMINQLKNIFGNQVQVEGKSLTLLERERLNNNDAILDYDVYLYTVERGFNDFKKRIPGVHLYMERSINHKYIKELIALPNGTEVLLINDTESNTYSTIEQLHSIGINHIKFHPMYPGKTKYPALPIAVTPGEVNLVPEGVERIIDIQSRSININTISKLVNILGIEQDLIGTLCEEYIRDVVSIVYETEWARKELKKKEDYLETLGNSTNAALAYMDTAGKILIGNDWARKIFRDGELEGRNLQDLIPIDAVEDLERVIKINGNEYFVRITSYDSGKNQGFVVVLENVQSIIKEDQRIRNQMVNSIISGLYSFGDFITASEKMLSTIDYARRFAKTDATILIEGENGTGKEIMAQSIHQESLRSDKSFVPVNIAAIPESLVESELFGYEEGAFTGASKKGKPGFFELANKGTIFIDEIGDLPLNSQVKLLRVLQEKKVRRIGGLEEIPIDIRVIAATNKNLFELVKQQHFREDLYYRLNVLPIKIPPLRRRREDILLLLDSFLVQENAKFKLDELFSDELKQFVTRYSWPGNVRELINFTQFISLIYNGNKLTVSQLPYYMAENNGEMEETIRLSDEQHWVLEKVSRHEGIGRVSLAKASREESFGLGEGKIRRILSELEKMGVIQSCEDRRGYRGTSKGHQLL